MTLMQRLINNLIRLNKTQTLCCWIRYSSHQVENNMPDYNDIPRRALMYCPGDDLRKINKALTCEADCIVLDCEDGVAINKKKEARETIRNILKGGNLPKHPEVSVRINSVDSGLCEDDLAAVLTTGNLPNTLLLPKVESEDHLTWLCEKLSKYMPGERKINLIMFAESARSIMNLPQICQKAQDLSKNCKFTPVGLVFGSDDLCASIGTARSVDGAELMYARQRLVLVAKAYHLQAIDMVHIQFKDLESLRLQSEAGARLGYTGKQVIHPSQINVVQKAFLPSPEQVKWAQDVVKSFEKHQQQGKGAFVHSGSMIDMPLLRQAQNIIKLTKMVERSV